MYQVRHFALWDIHLFTNTWFSSAGALPSSFSQLTALTDLDLESTTITGLDTNLFASLTKVTTVTLVKNAKMSNELPSSIFSLPLQNLYVVSLCPCIFVAKTNILIGS